MKTLLFRSLVALGLFLAPATADEPVSPEVRAWRAAGKMFQWKSTLPENRGRSVAVFYACMGPNDKPGLLLVHGWPTSSFDYHLLADELKSEFRICTLDFPGYGLSEKPADGYRYGLRDDAALVWHFASEVAGLKEFAVFSHDRGDSVTLAFLQLYLADRNPPFRITHHFMTNGNVYLPLANLTQFQKQTLEQGASAPMFRTMNAKLLAAGMGSSTYTPPLAQTDPEVSALADLFAFNNGVQVLPATIQYLNERKAWEQEFLDVLGRSTVPTTLMWGIHDMVSPVRVADHVWNTALKARATPASYWLIPCGGHYVQHDQARELAAIVRLAGKPGPAAPVNLSPGACGAVLNARQPQ